MLIKDLVAIDEPRAAWFEFGHGFEVQVRLLTRPQLRALFERTQTLKPNKRTHVMEREIDNTRFVNEIAALVLDWRGLTPRVLGCMIPIKAQQDPDTPIPCSHDNTIALIEMAFGFDTWLMEVATDAASFQEAADKADEKN